MVQADSPTLEAQTQNCSLEKYEPPSIDALQMAMQSSAWIHYTLGLYWMRHHHHQKINFQVHV
jgi:hypothetical protein